jgi:hypothetical protein
MKALTQFKNNIQCNLLCKTKVSALYVQSSLTKLHAYYAPNKVLHNTRYIIQPFIQRTAAIILLLLSMWLLSGAEAQAQNNVGIGTITPNAKAILELQATDKGLLVPRLTPAQMIGIVAPPNGLLIYNTTENCFNYYNAGTSTWKSMCSTTGISNNGDTVVINILKVDSLIAHYAKIDTALIKFLTSQYIKTDSIYTHWLRADSAYIKFLTSQYIKTDSIYAHLGKFDSLMIKGISIDSLIKQVTSNYLNSKDTVVLKYLRADSIYTKLLKTDSAFIKHLYAHTIKADTIIGGWGKFDSLYIGGKNILSTITDSIAAQAWLLKGNVAPVNNKLGTLNARDLHIVTNNNERITIMSGTGNVGIGQTLPSAKLDVLGDLQFSKDLKPAGLSGTTGEVLISQGVGLAPKWVSSSTLPSSANAWNILGNAATNSGFNFMGTTNNASVRFRTNNTEHMVIDSIGNVGIGTKVPNAKLQVWPLFNTDYGIKITMPTPVNNLITEALWIETDPRNYTQGTSIVMGAKWLGNNYTSRIVHYGDADATTGSRLQFQTRTPFNSYNNGIFINENGNVGVNNTAPANRLVVNVNTDDRIVMNQSSELNFGLALNKNVAGGLNNNVWQMFSGSNSNDLLFWNSAIVGNSFVHMILQSPTGNLGIGNLNPTERIDVTGSIKFSQALMPAGIAGTAGQVLTSAGAGVAPTWINASALPTPASAWNILGNAGTVAGTNFIGTTDNVDLVFKRNGVQSGLLNTAQFNTAFGVNALLTNSVNKIRNTAIGYNSMLNSTGRDNTATGFNTLVNNTSGFLNAAFGVNALANNTTATANTAIGANSLAANTTSSFNTAIGYEALNVSTGAGNTAVGASSSYSNTIGGNNTTVGYGALVFNTIGDNNTSIGTNSLWFTNGSNNTALGQGAGGASSNTLGNNNTFLGTSADATVNNLTNATAIGYNTKVGASNSLILGNGANVGIGKPIPTEKLDVVGNIRFSNALMPNNNAGTTGQILQSQGAGLPPKWSGHYIGEYYGGGIVFYVYDGGQHGLIGATVDASSSAKWNNGAPAVPGIHIGVEGNGINAGEMNTAIIVANQSNNNTATYAAKLCADYIEGGFGDWYLPSYDEAILMKSQSIILSTSPGYYWTSTEAYNSFFGGYWMVAVVWLDSGSGNISTYYTQDALVPVRAIRKF